MFQPCSTKGCTSYNNDCYCLSSITRHPPTIMNTKQKTERKNEFQKLYQVQTELWHLMARILAEAVADTVADTVALTTTQITTINTKTTKITKSHMVAPPVGVIKTTATNKRSQPLWTKMTTIIFRKNN